MKTLAQKYADGLYELTKDLEKRKAAEAVRRFVEWLAKRGRLRLGPAVIEAFERRARAAEGVLEVRLTTAYAPAERTVKELRTELEKRLGRKAILETGVDPGILGGAIIRFEDTLLDASLKRRLERLKKSLTAEG